MLSIQLLFDHRECLRKSRKHGIFHYPPLRAVSHYLPSVMHLTASEGNQKDTKKTHFVVVKHSQPVPFGDGT